MQCDIVINRFTGIFAGLKHWLSDYMCGTVSFSILSGVYFMLFEVKMKRWWIEVLPVSEIKQYLFRGYAQQISVFCKTGCIASNSGIFNVLC